MESKTIMLINSDDIDTFICEDINDTLTACSGDVTFRKLKKFWYSTDNQITVIITIYRECYDIKEKVRILFFIIVFFKFQPRALFLTSFVFER